MIASRMQKYWHHCPKIIGVLVFLIGACDKRQSQPPASPESAPAASPVQREQAPPKEISAPATPSPAQAPPIAPLPEATRFGKTIAQNSLTIPEGTPTHPEIPKPEFPGLADSIKREVISTYVEAVKAPDDAERVGEMGIVYLRLSSAGDAQKCLARAAKLDPKSVRWRYLLGMANEAAFDTPAALATYRETAELDPGLHGAQLHIADLLFKNDPKAAMAAYKKAAELAPQDARVIYGIAKCLLNEGKKSEAMEQLQKAVQLAPKYADAHRALAKLYRESGDKHQADIQDAMADQGGLPPVVRDPYYLDMLSRVTRGEALVSLVRQLIETAQLDLAASIIRRTLQWEPDNWEFHEQLGLIRWKQGQFKDAAEELQIVLDQNFSRSTVRGILAECLMEDGRYTEAEKVFTEVLSRNPDEVETLARHGEFLLRVGRGAEAAKVFERLQVASPDSPIYAVDLTIALLCDKKAPLAASKFKAYVKAGRVNRDLSDALVARLGGIMADQADARQKGAGNGSLGMADVGELANELDRVDLKEEARKLRDFIGGLSRTAVTLAEKNDFRQAFRLLQKAMEMDSGGRLRDGLRSVYLILSRRDSAIGKAWLKEGLERAEGQPLVANCVAWILVTCPEPAQRDGSKGLQLAAKASEAKGGNDPEFLDTLAAAYAEVGRFDDAVKTAEKAIGLCASKPQAADPIKQRLALYQAKQAFHAPR